MLFYSDPVTELHQGDAREVLAGLPEHSVHMAMCSPPFFGLRSYKCEPSVWGTGDQCEHEWGRETRVSRHKAGETNPGREGYTKNAGAWSQSAGAFCVKCNAWRGVLGLEPDPDLYISHLCDIFDQVKRVLKKAGTCWVNLADSYAGSGMGFGSDHGKAVYADADIPKPIRLTAVPAKSLIGVPARFQLEMIKRGWVCRSVIIWHKPSAMPEPAKDRFSRDFEYLYLFAQQGKYYFDQQREPQAESSRERAKYPWHGRTDDESGGARTGSSFRRMAETGEPMSTIIPADGQRNKRSVWRINTASYKGKHFAVYPEALCETPIQAGCPEFVCSKCGKPRKRVYTGRSQSAFNIRIRDAQLRPEKWEGTNTPADASLEEKISYNAKDYAGKGKQFEGYSDCKCGAPFVPGVVLDPFAGTGSTLAVAKRLGRKSIGIDLSETYCNLAKKRIEAVTAPMDVGG